jgi:citrate synthase
MPKTLPAFMSELPVAPAHYPVRKAIEKASDPEVAAALGLFVSMPPSTAVLANPVRYRHTVSCNGTPVELNVRSFGIRGCLFEEDIVNGSVDAARVIFVGLFGRFASKTEHREFSRMLGRELKAAIRKVFPTVSKFMKTYPKAASDTAIQYMASIQRATKESQGVNNLRPSSELLSDLIRTHLEHVAAGLCASYLRGRTSSKIDAMLHADPFRTVFNLVLRRKVTDVEARILEKLGTIQIHHGSAGSNMVARYLASLHTRTTSDLFIAAQMTLDSARHFGAISDLTDFVAELERVPEKKWDGRIRDRALKGNLPTFGHPEIATAGRANRLEVDPRPAIYLAPLFDAIDSGAISVSGKQLKRVTAVQRMYQFAFVEGIEKPGQTSRLRIAPNTDFGAWIVQEVLGVDVRDRTLLSYVFRGFGWMMDVREQLQQPIIRPVVPPDPAIVPGMADDGVIPRVIDSVHQRLSGNDCFS